MTDAFLPDDRFWKNLINGNSKKSYCEKTDQNEG